MNSLRQRLWGGRQSGTTIVRSMRTRDPLSARRALVATDPPLTQLCSTQRLFSGRRRSPATRTSSSTKSKISLPRTEFVAAVLKNARNFTLFGDPAQAIYQADARFRRGAQDAVARIEALFPDAAVVRLVNDYRTQSPRAVIAAHGRAALLDGNGMGAAYVDLLRSLRSTVRITIDDLPLVLSNHASKAILCRNGGEVLQISAALHSRHVAHRIQPRAADVDVPDWPARILAHAETERIGRDAFQILASENEVSGVDEKWRQLRLLAGSGSQRVDLRLVRERIDEPSRSSPSEAGSQLPLISTIHRARVLEFDDVIVLEPRARDEDVDDDEARILYVAMTRARTETLILERPPAPLSSRSDVLAGSSPPGGGAESPLSR